MESTNTPLGGKTALGTSPVIMAEIAQLRSLTRALSAAGNNPIEIRRALIANYPEPHASKLRATFAFLKLAV
jgi:hypothetical protein